MFQVIAYWISLHQDFNFSQLSSINSFSDFLFSVRADYLDTDRYISARASQMSDSGRARIDRDSVQFATEVARDIDQLKKLIGRGKASGQEIRC